MENATALPLRRPGAAPVADGRSPLAPVAVFGLVEAVEEPSCVLCVLLLLLLLLAVRILAKSVVVVKGGFVVANSEDGDVESGTVVSYSDD